MALNPDRFSLIVLVTAGHVNMAAVEKGPIVPLRNPRVIGVIMLIVFVFLSFAQKPSVSDQSAAEAAAAVLFAAAVGPPLVRARCEKCRCRARCVDSI